MVCLLACFVGKHSSCRVIALVLNKGSWRPCRAAAPSILLTTQPVCDGITVVLHQRTKPEHRWVTVEAFIQPPSVCAWQQLGGVCVCVCVCLRLWAKRNDQLEPRWFFKLYAKRFPFSTAVMSCVSARAHVVDERWRVTGFGHTADRMRPEPKAPSNASWQSVWRSDRARPVCGSVCGSSCVLLSACRPRAASGPLFHTVDIQFSLMVTLCLICCYK